MSDAATSPRPRPEDLEAIGALKLQARAVVEGVLAGLHRSPHKGASVEFAEYKEYAPGDDVRHIDWRAYGRKDRYYVKQFEDETNVRIYLLLDASGSMGFGFEGGPTKWAWSCQLVSALAWLGLRQGDAPGLLLFDSAPGVLVPPSSRRAQLDDIASVLAAHTPTGETRPDAALSRVAERVHARSIVVLCSDLLDDAEAWLTLARVLRKRAMEVVVFHVNDPAELELPYEGVTLFEGLEGEEDLLADPDDIRDAYKDAVAAHADAIRGACRAGDLEYYAATTDQRVSDVILRWLVDRAGGR